MRLLIVEDDRKVAGFLEKGLREEGYSVDVAHDGLDGESKAKIHDYDLLVLDVMLPGQSGLEIVRSVRASGSDVPVLLLTALDSEEDVVHGLDAGADDYLKKPFGLDELLARIRALLRRGGAVRDDSLRFADVEMDRIKHTVRRGGHVLDLTPKEYKLLEYFLLHPAKVVRRTELLEKVWDLQFDPMSNTVDVHVANLRKKLRGTGAPLLRTVRGVGYVLDEGPR